MADSEHINYKRIEKAIAYIDKNFKRQPSLEEMAAELNLSPYYFQKMFTEWAGVSPKKFIQYLGVNYAKEILREKKTSILSASEKLGLSSSGRLHDLFINIEAMSPGEYKNGAAGLEINYSYAQTMFGRLILASTKKGICYIGFDDENNSAFEDLMKRFPKAIYHEKSTIHHKNALSIFKQDWSDVDSIKLHLAASPFQLKVWEALLNIPLGALSTYGDIAQQLGNAKAARAIGNAIAQNPIAYLIPCHRVIQSSGKFGKYMWGESRKSAMIAWEATL